MHYSHSAGDMRLLLRVAGIQLGRPSAALCFTSLRRHVDLQARSHHMSRWAMQGICQTSHKACQDHARRTSEQAAAMQALLG